MAAQLGPCARLRALPPTRRASAPDHGRRKLSYAAFRDFFLLLPQQEMIVEYWVAAGAAPELSDKLSVAGRTGGSSAQGSPWGQ